MIRPRPATEQNDQLEGETQRLRDLISEFLDAIDKQSPQPKFSIQTECRLRKLREEMR